LRGSVVRWLCALTQVRRFLMADKDKKPKPKPSAVPSNGESSTQPVKSNDRKSQ
jgi:hypothetical protein